MLKRRSRMGAIEQTELGSNTTNPSSSLISFPVLEEIPGLIKVYKDGHVDRPPIVPEVPSTWSPIPDIASRDMIINHSTGVWARFYVPRLAQYHHQQQQLLLPLLVYFHGGGFCVGSAAWKCYHEFLARLSSQTNSVIMSVNYRLAPEHCLPAAYEDGVAAVKWIKKQLQSNHHHNHHHHQLAWCQNICNLNKMYLIGDSAGGAVAYNVAIQLAAGSVPDYIRGLILIHPFFGGETRTNSEKNNNSVLQSPKSALTLVTSDCYWRLALPMGTNRDHPLCNPKVMGGTFWVPPILVCIAEMDILKDRNLEFVEALRRGSYNKSTTVESVVHGGVGHAFQILNNYSLSQIRTEEMLGDINKFINNYS